MNDNVKILEELAVLKQQLANVREEIAGLRADLAVVNSRQNADIQDSKKNLATSPSASWSSWPA